MAYIEQRLPLEIEVGAVRREREDLEMVETDGGYEVINIRHSRAKWRWDVSFPTGDVDDSIIAAVKVLFRASRGGAHYFRFRDKFEHTLSAEPIGTGTGALSTFQVKKTWAVGGVSQARIITRPITPLEVFKDGVLQTSGYSVNYSTGIVTFSSPPGDGEVITVTGEYDIPVRFDMSMESTAVSGWLEHLGGLTLVEKFE